MTKLTEPAALACYSQPQAAWPTGETVPSLPEFREIARSRRVIPLVRRFIADSETAIGLYTKLAAGRPGTFLMESAEHGRSWSRYSFIGTRSAAMLTEVDGQARWLGSRPVGLSDQTDPLELLQETLELLDTPPIPGLPPLTGGLVGAVGYDAVRHWEKLPQHAAADLPIPTVAMLLATDLAVLDHELGAVLLIANAINYDATDARVDEAYLDAQRRLDVMEDALRQPAPATIGRINPHAHLEVSRRTSETDYLAGVGKVKEYIHAGDAFQVVLSQRFDIATTANPLDVYRVLRGMNPSPYMYLMNFPAATDDSGGSELPETTDLAVVGSSPEALVTVRGKRATMHPIAGSRPRGATPEEDHALGLDLLGDAKERAEHLMLVDLGRNDLGRVCQAGSISIVDFMALERYSHIMHLVSTIAGDVRADVSAFEVLQATFPAGTLSGAPKPRAMEIIDELEPTRRGIYGGVVGYFDFAGNMDVAIAIRTATMRSGMAYIQAGAGVVADSVPEREDAECANKAAAVIRAVSMAQSLQHR